MNVVFTVTVELSRESGKFASRDEIVDALSEQIGNALDEGVSGVGADGDSEYVVDDYAVEVVRAVRKKRS